MTSSEKKIVQSQNCSSTIYAACNKEKKVIQLEILLIIIRLVKKPSSDSTH